VIKADNFQQTALVMNRLLHMSVLTGKMTFAAAVLRIRGV
jgi:hypothetical protein